jgi:hypothetical protein
VAQLRARQRTPLQLADAIATSLRAPDGTTLATVAFVDLVHQQAFGRAPAASDRAFWVARIDRGAPRGELVLSLARTATVRWATSRTVQAAGAHLALLRRLPTADEQQAWEQALWSGTPYGALIGPLLSGAEYRARFGG